MKTKLTFLLALLLPALLHAQTPPWTSGQYVYDGSGNIIGIGTNQYVYDQAGRLTSGTVNGTTYKQTYGYDSFGNRVSVSNCVGTECVQRLVPAVPSSNHLQDSTVGYGEAGNVESDTTGGYAHTYAFDAVESMAVQTDGSTTHEYIYTADDQRIAVHTGTDWRWSVRDLGHRVVRELTSKDQGSWSVAQDYVYTDSGVAGTLSIFGRRYTHNDHLGTPRLVTADDGHQVGAHAYYAFGEELPIGSEAPEEHFKFTGHERDRYPNGAAGLDYMHARYYGAVAARFLSVDPVLGDAGEPQSWNRYSYARNNPVNRTDPDGRFDWDFPKLVKGVASALGVHWGNDSAARVAYKAAIAPLKQGDAGASAARSAAKVAARQATSPGGAKLAETMRPIANEASRAGGSVAKSNAAIDAAFASPAARAAGPVLVAASVSMSVVRIANAPEGQGYRTMAGESGAMLGAVSFGEGGAWAGATAGAAIGACFGGVGAVPGAAIGGIIGLVGGGIGGSVLGEQAAHNVYDATVHQ